VSHKREFLALCCPLGLVFFRVAAEAAELRPIDGIADNSFLIEEAYNQEPGVVQHIFSAQFGAEREEKPRNRGWTFNFTQEWPIFSELHQFSYTIPIYQIHGGGESQSGIGDILLNYRLQAIEESECLPAFAPRLSLILPTGSVDKGTGYGAVGYQWNFPISKKVGPRLAFHANAGLTHIPRARARSDGVLSPRRSLLSPNLGASGIFAFT